MRYVSISCFCLFLFFFNLSTSQNIEHIKAINTDVWKNFTKAFETLDVELFSSLHSNDLIRVNGDHKTTRGKTSYMKGYKNHWNNKDIHQTIAFRFLERISDSTQASERGIYKLTRHPNTPNEISYYGKFHVILKYENNKWVILVDYDSTENNTVNETTFNTAFAMNDFDKF